jgi:hypothetical protein
MKNTLIIILSIFLYAVSCTHLSPHFSPEIETILQQAGDNREELEKVLIKYRRSADSLKLRAAEFLILNMPGKYSEYYDAPWEDVATVSYLLPYALDKEKLLNDYHLGQPVVQDDLHYITAKYLIDNIELAFKSWKTAPWGKHVTFDIFCEYILPYRISTEPLENWREQALASYSDMYHSLLDSAGMTTIIACSKINKEFPNFIYGGHFPSMSYRQLMASTRGSHEQQATLATFVMRAMGIPVTLDVMLQPSLSNWRAWNIVCDSAGRYTPFVAAEKVSGHWIPRDDWMMAKVFRHTFRRQEYSANIPSEIPHSLANFIDVTSEYGDVTNIDIAIFPEADIIRPPEYACLAIANSSLEWMPVCFGKYHNGTYQFTSIGVNTLYLPVIYENGEQRAFNQPFFLTDNGKVIYFEQYGQDSTESSVAYPRWRNLKYKAANVKIINNLSGRWLFEDTANYGKATVGKDMVAYKMTNDNSKETPSTIGLKRVAGTKTGKNAVRIPCYNYFKCMHGIFHNGIGKNINEYTILMDVKIPVRKSNHYFIQTNMDNADDIDIFLSFDMIRFGESQFYCDFDPPVQKNKWYRLVISARLGQSLKYYLNGELVFANYNTKLGMLDSRLSLAKESLLLFANNNYDEDNDNDIDVSEVAIFNRALIDEEVFSLGCAGNEWTVINKNR